MNPGDWKPKYNPWLISLAVMSATFMEVLDTSIANVALPHIAGSMAATTEEATWVVTSYLVANAIVLPLTGFMGARFGRKRFLMVCVIAFTLASVLSGAAQSLSQLIFFRILQGLGGGAMQPMAQSIMLESFPREKRGAAMAFFGLGVVVAPILGPVLGGWLTDNYSWRWAFYINLPVGLLSIVLSFILLEDPPWVKQGGQGKVDYAGFFALALWVASLQIVLDKGQTEDWFESRFIIGLTVIFVVFLIGFVARELSTDNPIVNLSIFGDRSFALGTAMICVVGMVLYGSVTLSPLFLQQLLGYPAYEAGLAMAPRGMGAMTAMFIVGPALARLDGRLFVAGGFAILGTSNLWLGHLNLEIGVRDIGLPNFLSGLGTGFIFVPLTTLATASLPVRLMGSAAGMYNLLRNLGGGVGIATATTMLTRGAQKHQAILAAHVTADNPAYQEYLRLGSQGAAYREMLQQAAMLSYIDAYNFMASLCFVCIPAAFLLKKSAPGAKPPPGAH